MNLEITSFDKQLNNLGKREILEVSMPLKDSEFIREHIKDRGYIAGECNSGNSIIYHIKSINKNKNA
jgi:hypothetical protein